MIYECQSVLYLTICAMYDNLCSLQTNNPLIKNLCFISHVLSFTSVSIILTHLFEISWGRPSQLLFCQIGITIHRSNITSSTIHLFIRNLKRGRNIFISMHLFLPPFKKKNAKEGCIIGESFMYHCIKNFQQNIDTKSKDPSHQPSFIGACSLTHRFATGLLESFSHLYHRVAFTCP